MSENPILCAPKRNVAILWKDDYPWDVRIEKFASTLSGEGHRVSIIAGNSKGARDSEIFDYAVVQRLSRSRLRSLNRLKSLPLPLSPTWLHKVYSVCKKDSVEVLIVRDLPLVLSAILIGRLLRIPVIFDMAENYPALWEELVSLRPGSLKLRILKNPALAKVMERYSLRRVAHIFVVVEESRDRLLGMDVPPERITIVSNTPALQAPDEQRMTTMPERKSRFTLLYHGYINRGRGLLDAVHGVALLSRRYPSVHLKLIGIGDHVTDLKRIVHELGLSENVSFVGWMPNAAIAGEIESCAAGVIPHTTSEHKNTTIPNKLFDYMSYGKPVIVSDAKPLQRIVEQERCGLVFSSGKPSSFAVAVEKLLSDQDMARAFGESGRRAVKRRYNWGVDSLALNNAVMTLGAKSAEVI